MAESAYYSQNSEQIGYFFSQVLSKPAGALPKGAQWIIYFDEFPSVIGNVAKYEPKFGGQGWNIQNALKTATMPVFQFNKGCMFAQAVTLPSDGFTPNPVGTQYGGLIRTTVGGGRQDFDTLRITFVDNNVSFTENVLRPWTIVTSHLGMIAYPKGSDLDYRTNIYVYKLGVTSLGIAPHIRQKYSFYGVCPVSISGEEQNYTAASAPHIRISTFAYNYYNIDSSADIIANGKFDGNPPFFPSESASYENSINVGLTTRNGLSINAGINL